MGTGTGALSAPMAPKAAAVITVEIDPQLFQLASEELFGFKNVTMLEQDALRNKSHLDDRVIEAVQSRLAEAPNRRLKLVSNLPYSVATPVVANLLGSDIVPYEHDHHDSKGARRPDRRVARARRITAP